MRITSSHVIGPPVSIKGPTGCEFIAVSRLEEARELLGRGAVGGWGGGCFGVLEAVWWGGAVWGWGGGVLGYPA